MIEYPVCVFEPIKTVLLSDQDLICFIRQQCGSDVADYVSSFLLDAPAKTCNVLPQLRSAYSDVLDGLNTMESIIEKLEAQEE